ncbi:MAG: hypothetical protein OXF07_11420 [Rhodobacter sp.]|nr:hypothetical protein [Rhodobacter sp.]
MTLTTKRIGTATAALLAAAILAGCGGGGAKTDQTKETGMPKPDEPTAIEELEWGDELLDLEAERPEEVKAGLGAATSSVPRFGSITQSGSSLGGTGGRASVSYDRESGELNITLNRSGVKGSVPGDIEISSEDRSIRSVAANRKETFNAWSGFARQFLVYDPEVQGTGGGYSPGTTIVTVTVEYPEYNDTDYLAGGFWMRENGGGRSASTFGGGNEFTSAEFGAFVDGSDFDANVPPPDSGTATYEGSVHGLAYSYGEGALDTRRVYTWSKDMELTADFSGNTISGCMGCVITDPLAELYEPVDPRFILEGAEIGAAGTFADAGVRMEWDRYPGASSDGSWGGKFLLPEEPAPGAAAGTMGVEWTHGQGNDETGGHFLGYWYATHDERKYEPAE